MPSATIRTEPLRSFPQIRTADLDELAQSVKGYYGPVSISRPSRHGRLNVVANHWQIDGIGLTYARHGAEVEVSVDSFAFYAQLYAHRGGAEIAVGRQRIAVDSFAAFVANPNDAIRLSYRPDFEKLILKLDHDALVTKLESLSGRSINLALRFDRAVSLRRAEPELLFGSIMQLIRRIDLRGTGGHPVVTKELADNILVEFLISNGSNYSHYLTGQPTSTGWRELNLTEEYIEANWDQPITMEALTAVSGVSARTLYYTFQRLRGYSPKSFVTALRLQQSHSMLTQPGPMTTVTDVALACGFGNLGHFSVYYRNAFGESPSESLRRARTALRPRRGTHSAADKGVADIE